MAGKLSVSARTLQGACSKAGAEKRLPFLPGPGRLAIEIEIIIKRPSGGCESEPGPRPGLWLRLAAFGAVLCLGAALGQASLFPAGAALK